MKIGCKGRGIIPQSEIVNPNSKWIMSRANTGSVERGWLCEGECGKRSQNRKLLFYNLNLPLTVSPILPLSEPGLILDQLRGSDFGSGRVGEKSKIATYTFTHRKNSKPVSCRYAIFYVHGIRTRRFFMNPCGGSKRGLLFHSWKTSKPVISYLRVAA